MSETDPRVLADVSEWEAPHKEEGNTDVADVNAIVMDVLTSKLSQPLKSKSMVEFCNVMCQWVDDKPVLQDVSFKIGPKSLFCVAGALF